MRPASACGVTRMAAELGASTVLARHSVKQRAQHRRVTETASSSGSYVVDGRSGERPAPESRISAFPQPARVFHPRRRRPQWPKFRVMPAHLHLAELPTHVPVPIRVVLADDHALMRRSLRILLDGEDDVAVIAEAADLATVVSHLGRHRPNVLVADLRLSKGSSIDALRRLRAQAPDTEVVVLTMEESPLFAQQAMDAGAIGYVLKDRADSELPTAIRCAANGEECVSARVAKGLEALRKAVDRDSLTPREIEVVRLIALGFTSAEIAVKLRLSRRIVESHRARIFNKLGVSTRAELVQFALRRRLIGT
jgi:two-component system response regulator NreC